MQSAVRPYLTSGVALVGASVIAVSPLVVTPPDIKLPVIPVSSAAVQLTATVDPITAWLEVATSAFGNASAIAGEILADPAPALRQFLENQLGYGQTLATATQGAVDALVNYVSPDNPSGLVAQLQTAFDELSAGNVAGAVTTLSEALILGPILNLGLPLLTSGLLAIPATMAQNFANVVTTLTSVQTALPLVFGGLGAVLGPINAFGDSLQGIVDAVGAGEPVAALGALINAPAVITGALLNGYENLQGTEFPGLLSFGDNAFNSGIIQTLLVTIPRAIAEAIAPPAASATTSLAPAEVTSMPSDDTTMVALSATEPEATLAESNSSPTTVVETEGPAAADETEGPAAADETEGPAAADETEEPAGGTGAGTGTDENATEEDEADGSTTGNGATDLSDGNKVAPKETVKDADDGDTAKADTTDTNANVDTTKSSADAKPASDVKAGSDTKSGDSNSGANE